ncbi:tRNA1(Val) (adenine(37)-N6)-methyltransferase [Bacteroidota bacterium]
MAFRFKQFTIEDCHSTMQVGTDSILLGSLTDPGDAKRILDIGTGCGVLALMMAQKSKAIVDAIELDDESVREANENFERSPWNTRLACFGISLQLTEILTDNRYDLIISNPPFFKDSLRPPDPQRSLARHDLKLTFDELVKAVTTLISKDGRFSCIIPANRWDEARKLAENRQLYPRTLIQIYPYPGGKVTRMIVEFTKEKIEPVQTSDFTILNDERKYTAEYLEATKDFHYF